MISFLSIVAIGFFLGMRHATDPDHVVAVTTIVSRQKKIASAALTGIVWGIGHTLTILVVGAAIVLFGVVIPARIGLGMEFSVALMLIALGVMNLLAFLRSARSIEPAHAVTGSGNAERHGDSIDSHLHSSSGHSHPHDFDNPALARMDQLFGKLAAYRQLRPLVIGIVHGLAGSAAVALLVLTTIRDPRWAVAYLLVFGIGTVAGMMLITMSIASAFTFFGRRHSKLTRHLGFASGLLSLAFGILLVYQIGIADGLFGAHPHWSPR